MDMNHSDSKNGYLGELNEFLAFLKNLWGILTGISVFFPFSNILINAIPLRAYGTDNGVFDQLSPYLITTIATVVTLFVVLITFAYRSQFKNPKKRGSMLRNAWISFGISILSLLTYLVIHQVYREYAWEPWGWGSGDPRKLIAEIPLLVAYVIFFSLLTRAFMLLGMIEFFGRRDARDRSSQRSA
jgi:magnesium-transporting ATPase (P-type)